ncbi:MAG: hypothetical protein JO080_02225 [Mucilaginibacter sp.]|nr:hypothetical protein [Mucilaginibacter sp.]
MNRKLLLEFIPLTLFIICGIFAFFKIPYSHLLTLLTGFLVASLYFYGAFWLFAATGAPVAVRIIAGLSFSITIVSSIFGLLHWPFWKLYAIISYAGLGITMVICLIYFKSIAIRPLLYRSLLFVAVLSSIYYYRSVVIG